MKKIKKTKKSNFLKKIFIKICRILGFEIIDQSSFSSPTIGKDLNETLSEQGKRSITVPLGQIKITKKIKSLKIIVRTCTSELIMDQNKRRIFDCEKNEYTFRSLKSLVKSLNKAIENFNNINFEQLFLILILHKQIWIKLANQKFQEPTTALFDLDNLKRIEDGCLKILNMANFYNSLLIAKNEEADLLYFVEDDYLHTLNSITEMIFSYEKFYSLFNNEIILLPSDYPYLYSKDELTKIYLGEKNHWRLVSESLVTFMLNKTLINKYFEDLEKMGKVWEDPWEKPLHNIYKSHPCLSPIPSLAIHCTNINSVFGLSPFIDIKKLWENNRI